MEQFEQNTMEYKVNNTRYQVISVFNEDTDGELLFEKIKRLILGVDMTETQSDLTL